MTHRLSLALVLMALGAPLAANDVPTLTKSYSFRVSVDEQGRANEVEPVSDVPAPLQSTLNALVQGAEFEPAQRHGRAVPSRTSVHVVVRLEGEGDEVRAVPVDILAGGRLDNSAPPRYPHGALRDGVAAEVWATLSFRADGSLDHEASRVDSVDMVREGRPRDPVAHRNGFEAAVVSAMAKWTLVPDEVDGRPIAMTVRVPTRFCPASRQRLGCDDLWPKEGRSTLSPAPRDDSVRLATLKPAATAADGG